VSRVALRSIAIACVLWSGSARALEHEARRVALLNADAELLRSVSIALSPWQLEVLALEAPSPPRSLPEAAVEARELSRSLGANAVVWVSIAETTSVVWVYDAQSQRVSSRVQAQLPPFDGPAAAAVALSLKTMLRTTELAPLGERFGATPAPRPAWPALLRLEVTAGARAFAPDALEPWLSLGAAVWPARSPGSWGLSMRAAFTTGAGVAADSLSGVVRELAFSAALRRWIALGDAVGVVPFAGASAHLSQLDGAVTATGAPVSVTRVNPSIDAGVALPIRAVGSFDLGPYLAASYMTRTQRYLVHGAVALEAWAWSLELGAQATMAVF
jgi:hypothetical protein